MATRCFIDTLEDGLLERVFEMLWFEDCLLVLPLVSKRWARILSRPSAVWQVADIDLHELHHCDADRQDGRPLLDPRVITAWFGRRANCIRELYIWDDFVIGAVPAAVMAAALGSQCSSLEELGLHAADVSLAGHDIAVLAVLTRLTRLQVTVSTVLFEDRDTTLICAVQQLPALEYLDINHDGTAADVLAPISDNNGLPQCQLAALHSNSLTELRVCMLGGPTLGNMLRLGNLPKLRSLSLAGDVFLPMHMRIDAASFQGAPTLEALRLCFDEGLGLQPGSLMQLSALTALAITSCGLRTVPEDVALLSATLRQLDLSSNHQLQIDDAGMASILGCSHLERLNLKKANISCWRRRVELSDVYQRIEQHFTREGYTPVQFSTDSVDHLVQLRSAFLARHGRDLRIILK